MRIDQALVEKGLFKTRTKAKEALLSGIVSYDGKTMTKPSFEVDDLSLLEIKGPIMPYVSRGGLKLEKALHSFKIDLQGKIVLDIGSSTGGFTDCALKNGAQSVIAVDVGTNQLDSSLRNLPTVTLYEQTDFRDIEMELIEKAKFACIDVSFISVKKLLSKLEQLALLVEIVCLIKPQFECGKEIADKYQGVIKHKEIHEKILQETLNAFSQSNFYCHGLTFSPIAGGSGNREYLGYFTKVPTKKCPDITKVVTQAFDEI